MILVDTSIWIEFFRQNPDYAKEVALLLENKMIVTIEPVFSELIYGAQSPKEKDILIAYWNVLPKIRFTEGSFIQSAEFANNNKYQHLGIGLIDATLAIATVQNNLQLWTLDKKLIGNLDQKYFYKIN